MKSRSPDQGAFAFEEDASAEQAPFFALCVDYKNDRRINQYLTPIKEEHGRFMADNGDVYERDPEVDIYRMVVSNELSPELKKIVDQLMTDPKRNIPHRDAAIELANIELARRKSGKSDKGTIIDPMMR